MHLGKAAFLRPFGLYKQLAASITHLCFQSLRITPLDLFFLETAKIYFHTIAVTFAFLSILYRAHFFFAMVQYLYFVISKRRARLDFLRNRRQLRNNAQKIIFDFLFAWLAAHQKIIRADMEDAGQFNQQVNGAAAFTVLHAAFGRLRLSAAPQHSYDL